MRLFTKKGKKTGCNKSSLEQRKDKGKKARTETAQHWELCTKHFFRVLKFVKIGGLTVVFVTQTYRCKPFFFCCGCCRGGVACFGRHCDKYLYFLPMCSCACADKLANRAFVSVNTVASISFFFCKSSCRALFCLFRASLSPVSALICRCCSSIFVFCAFICVFKAFCSFSCADFPMNTEMRLNALKIISFAAFFVCSCAISCFIRCAFSSSLVFLYCTAFRCLMSEETPLCICRQSAKMVCISAIFCFLNLMLLPFLSVQSNTMCA